MKLMLISADFPPRLSGVGDFTFFLADRWSRRSGGKLIVVTSKGEDIARQHDHNAGYRLIQLFQRMTLPEFRRLLALVREQHPEAVDIQFTQNSYTWKRWGIICFVAALRLTTKVKIVITFHEFFDPLCHSVGSFLRGWPQRLRAGLLLCLTHGALVAVAPRLAWCRRIFFWKRRLLAETLIGGNIEVREPGEEKMMFLREKYRLSPGHLVFSLFGHISTDKDFRMLFLALGRLRDDGIPFRMILIGKADETSRYIAHLRNQVEVQGLQESVEWTGALPAAEVSALLRMSDLYLTPYKYGAGNRNGSIQAAIAHGVPIVTTRGSYTPAYWEEGVHMLTAAPGDFKCFAGQVKRLCRDEELRETLAKNLLELYQRYYTWEAIADATYGYMERLLGAAEH